MRFTHPTRQEIEKTRQPGEADRRSPQNNGFKRIGFALVGLLFFSLGIFIVIDVGESTPMVFLPFGAFATLLGVTVICSVFGKRKS